MWCPELSLDAELAGMLRRPQPGSGCRSERKRSLLGELLNKSNQSSDIAHEPELPFEILEPTGYGSAHNIFSLIHRSTMLRIPGPLDYGTFLLRTPAR